MRGRRSMIGVPVSASCCHETACRNMPQKRTAPEGAVLSISFDAGGSTHRNDQTFGRDDHPAAVLPGNGFDLADAGKVAARPDLIEPAPVLHQRAAAIDFA